MPAEAWRRGARSRTSRQGPTSDEALLRRFIAAWVTGDVDAFTALLAEDAIPSMPPRAEWYEGRAAIGRFFERLLAADPRRYRLLPLGANGSPAAAVYAGPAGGPYDAVEITLFSIARDCSRVARDCSRG